MHYDHFKITAYSTALFSTWIFIEEWGLLLDAGDGLSAGLLQKSRKIKQVLLSHADRDHIMGLFQFNQLNAREDYPRIYYPADSGSFPAMESFSKQFDAQVGGTTWLPVHAGQEILIKDQLFARAIRNGHLPVAPGKSKSLSYQLFEVRQKLKAEFQGLDQEALKMLSQQYGKGYLTERVEVPVLGYSGDSPVEDYTRWDGFPILIHEATFLESRDDISQDKSKHSWLEEVLKMVAEINVRCLILTHFSSRYAQAEIDEAILRLCKKHKITIPVYRVLPGEIARDILSGEPINA